MSESGKKTSDPKIIYDYPSPVSKLLAVGDAREISGWPNYLELGLTTEHVPDLVRMALDEDLHWADGESDEVWGPLHAWRALAQLRAEAAVEPLVELLSRVDEYDDDWTNEELPEVFGHIGRASIEPVARFLADSEQGLWSRIAAASSFAEISKRHSELRTECVDALTRQLEQYSHQDPTLNGFIINYLTELKAVESAPVMEQAFAADSVAISIQGDWEDTQISLGLLQERLTPQPKYHPLLDNFLSPLIGESPRPAQPQPETPRRAAETKSKAKIRTKLEAARKTKAKTKAKRKQQKKARKKQRKGK